MKIDSKIIVLKVKDRQAGFIADGATRVLRIDEEDIERNVDLANGMDQG